MTYLNLISVTESAERKITASGARLLVRISGQSFFTGREAFKKAAELSELVAELGSCGIPEDNLLIKNISTQVASGFLLKSSSASYHVEVLCDAQDLVAPAIAIVASMKNSELVSIAWNYADLEDTKKQLLKEAVRSVNESATAIALALNATLVGVHRLRYEISGLDHKMPNVHRSGMGGGRLAQGFSEEMNQGLSLSHTAEVTVLVTADFQVTPHSGT